MRTFRTTLGAPLRVLHWVKREEHSGTPERHNKMSRRGTAFHNQDLQFRQIPSSTARSSTRGSDKHISCSAPKLKFFWQNLCSSLVNWTAHSEDVYRTRHVESYLLLTIAVPWVMHSLIFGVSAVILSGVMACCVPTETIIEHHKAKERFSVWDSAHGKNVVSNA